MSDISFFTLMSGGLVVWNAGSMVAPFPGIDLESSGRIKDGELVCHCALWV
jgi:hypothetical protein